MSQSNPLKNTPPANTEPDGRLYSLEVGYSMDAIGLDIDGNIAWKLVGEVTTQLPEYEELSGTYAEVSEKAAQINATQHRLYGKIEHVFYPSPIAMLAA